MDPDSMAHVLHLDDRLRTIGDEGRGAGAAYLTM